MAVNELVESARGTILPDALNGDWQEDTPSVFLASLDSGQKENSQSNSNGWSFDSAPIELLQDGEQPQYMGFGYDRALKIRADENSKMEEASRVSLDSIQKGIISDGKIGYVEADDSCPNFVFVTNRRLLLIIGKDDEDTVISFKYDDQEISSISSSDYGAIYADGLEYELRIGINPTERSRSYQYLHQETPLTVEGKNHETAYSGASSEIIESEVTLAELETLTPRGFETYIADVRRAQGYASKLTKKNGDGGIDIISMKDGDRELLQAKRYTQQNVGIETVQRTAGLLVDDEFDASEVGIITTSGFTKAATQRANQINNLKLVSGAELVKIANELGVGIMDDRGASAYPQKATAEQVLSTLLPGEPLTTEEIVGQIDAPPRSILSQLESLSQREDVQAKKVGEDTAIWYKIAD